MKKRVLFSMAVAIAALVLCAVVFTGCLLDLLGSTYTISGTITADYPVGALEGATVTLKEDGIVKGSTTTIFNGTYAISSVADGTYTIEVSKSGYNTGTIPAFTVMGANENGKDLMLIASITPNPTYTISGTITADTPEGTLEGATIILKDDGGTVRGSVTTAYNGIYTISNVANGVYTIEVSKNGYITGTIPAIVVFGANVSGKDLRLIANITPTPTYTVSGTITADFPAGPLSGATVTLYDGAYVKGSATTALNGTYTISGVVNGTYTIEVSKTGYVTDTIPSFMVLDSNATGKDLLLHDDHPSIVPGATLEAKFLWLKNNARNFWDYTVYVTAHDTLTAKTIDAANLNNSGTVKITLEGVGVERMVQLSGGGPLFTIKNGYTLVLENNIKLMQGGGNNGSLILVDTGGTLIMETGSSVTNVTVSSTAVWCGSVQVWGNFTMKGGAISDNNGHYGGGVAVYGGIFTMNGGSITNNTVYSSGGYDGGGVYVDDGATFILINGTISGNQGGRGGGVYAAGIFNMSGGTISGNQADDGGGVYVGKTFNMNGGTIAGNTAKMGGGVFVGVYGTISKTAAGGIIYGNDALDAVYKNTATGGTAGKAGHAIYIYGGSYDKGWRNSTINANEALTAVNGGVGIGIWGD